MTFGKLWSFMTHGHLAAAPATQLSVYLATNPRTFCLHSLMSRSHTTSSGKENINPLENISHHDVKSESGQGTQLLGGERADNGAYLACHVSCVRPDLYNRWSAPGPRCWVLDVDPGLTVKEGTRSKPGQTVGAAFQTFKTTAVRWLYLPMPD